MRTTDVVKRGEVYAVDAINAIRTARILKRMSQSEAAEALGVAQNTVSRWENGKTEPSLSDLIKMGEIYEVSLDRLCGVMPR